MNWKFSSLLAAVAAMGLQSANGFVYVSDFTPNSVGDNLAGADGWTQSEANPAVDQPLSWIGLLNSQKAGAVGTYYGLPAGSSFFASREIGVLLDGATLGMDFSIQDSTTDFPNRNNYSISVVNGSGVEIFSLNFIATDQTLDYDDPALPADPATSNTQWNMTWTSALSGQSSPSPFAGVLEDGLYRYAVSFAQSGTSTNVWFSITGSGTYSDTITLNGVTGETLDSIRVATDIGSGADWGDNFIAFQGVVPEPASTLLLGISSLLCLRRRR